MPAPLSFVTLQATLLGYPRPAACLRLAGAYSLLGALLDIAGRVGIAQVRWDPAPETPCWTCVLTLPPALTGVHGQPAAPLATVLATLVGCLPHTGATLLTQIHAIDQAYADEPPQDRLTRLQPVWPGPLFPPAPPAAS